MSRRDVNDEEHERAKIIRDIVVKWAQANAANDLHYGSPQSYYASARAQGVITDDEYDLMARWHGDMWMYRGD
jgi:hypothetical protein